MLAGAVLWIARDDAPACDRHRFDAGAWHDARVVPTRLEARRWRSLGRSTAACAVPAGSTDREVRQRLGRPTYRSRDARDRLEWTYLIGREFEAAPGGAVTVWFAPSKRVEETRFDLGGD
ncbi:hypothetical protein Q5424_15650 [Conexibacter sp. JD483]|uniref:hypothetical protein n=1 Tax=unclassified Conexibacter TaxID=2627773 RepID=UPI0027224F2A|nr:MULTISPECIES: hypothetical protein [unclassified Conexibacter]MDO8185298.1 hypothetical protein [Conexibacter sp. CPCC 205706]MDO8198344.1 hypothetical protein [Conexibacter sp. CPCC 205762]MDR9370531.1 hypothetical protein [Conexibacter sp. JD483]